ncbi:enolase C-terminal domain-like protein [Plantactinospora sp. GCM10030261]|uniref:enolase C-terminal domain-like protein n=1 Tax=Plantactinospora sp. GCM10030261 TaxID=3273420 RepID=UPI0036238974
MAAWPGALVVSVTGENLTGLEQYRPLILAGAVDVVQMAAVWGITHFQRVSALAHAHDLPVSPIGNVSIGLLHAATSVPNHLTSELQDLCPPVGVVIDVSVEDGAFVLGDSPGLGVRIDEDAIRAASGRPAVHHPGEGPHVRPERAGRRLLAGGDAIGTATTVHPVPLQPSRNEVSPTGH